MTDQTLRVTVTRQEPGAAPRDETFDVPFDDRTTVLDALDWIKDHTEPSLTFRWSCRMGVCGSCGVMVNGRPLLGCETTVAGYRTSGITVGPMAHATVQRDLAVDTDEFLAKLRGVQPWMLPTPATESAEPAEPAEPGGSSGPSGAVEAPAGPRTEDVLAVHSQTPGEVEAYKGLSQCIDCMLCYAACPVLDDVADFTGPAAIATARRWDLDSRDEGNETRFSLLAENETGIWPCIQVGACTRACPKGVDPARAIRDYQREAMGG
ncbi:succinate dehydrogenase and fumarate reductase iron-sulfur protein [Xylanimonas cellulosilytica DSM 15894]|uniref:Fumarate reductase iron-sulfur subunit n=1 Tax=Xylanimonas cellulosilytica (strain DSM 15894 / JCM 12276 / CECT 5975 / KCTC 9989 / LMG 20990 / NBRC 107835 / XIL07) TaxID=446471 RepID=D1BU42_XYLCX|nr:succinate dehydrogenase/fumarate reductase iron-sulfur subunit [Xylanimonas cellulosilytica]ACZ29206.1 succinate dehydrogenase and fumarate reductase iron-sulfur protein [Xylanimonas cellulosilytica DSM 15894]